MGLYRQHPDSLSRWIPLIVAEPFRFQIHHLRHASFLWDSIHLGNHLHRRLRSGSLHRSKSAVFRSLVRSSETGNTFPHLPLDICGMHLVIVDPAGLQVDTGRAGNSERCDCPQLSGSSRGRDTECAHMAWRSRVEKIPRLCGAYKRPKRR